MGIWNSKNKDQFSPAWNNPLDTGEAVLWDNSQRKESQIKWGEIQYTYSKVY